MSDNKWLLTGAEVQKLLLDWPIGMTYDSAIKAGAKEQLAKLRRLGWQEPKMLLECGGCGTTYLWTKRGLVELKPCEVRLIEFPRLYKEEK